MVKPEQKAIHIPNSILVAFAIVLAAVAAWSYALGLREVATMTIAGSGLFLSALNFSLPAMPLALRLIVVPILLSPFAILMLLLFNVI